MYERPIETWKLSEVQLLRLRVTSHIHCLYSIYERHKNYGTVEIHFRLKRHNYFDRVDHSMVNAIKLGHYRIKGVVLFN